MNGRTLNFSQTFNMPWSEDDKWTAANRWQVRAEASSPVSLLSFATTNFPLLIADLGLGVDPSAIARPGEFVSLTGTIRNLAAVQTEPGFSSRSRHPLRVLPTVTASFSSSWFFSGYLAHKRRQARMLSRFQACTYHFPLNLAK